MPAKNPRINVVVEKPLYGVISNMARKSGLSMGALVRDLVKEAIEVREDIELARIADERKASMKGRRPLSHAEVWGA